MIDVDDIFWYQLQLAIANFLLRFSQQDNIYVFQTLSEQVLVFGMDIHANFSLHFSQHDNVQSRLLSERTSSSFWHGYSLLLVLRCRESTRQNFWRPAIKSSTHSLWPSAVPVRKYRAISVPDVYGTREISYAPVFFL